MGAWLGGAPCLSPLGTLWYYVPRLQGLLARILLWLTYTDLSLLLYPVRGKGVKVGVPQRGGGGRGMAYSNLMGTALYMNREKSLALKEKRLKDMEKKITNREISLGDKMDQNEFSKAHVVSMENRLKELQYTNRLLRLKLLAVADGPDQDNPSPVDKSETLTNVRHCPSGRKCSQDTCGDGASIRDLQQRVLSLEMRMLEQRWARIESLNQTIFSTYGNQQDSHSAFFHQSLPTYTHTPLYQGEHLDNRHIPSCQGIYVRATHAPLYQGPCVAQPNEETSSCPVTSSHVLPGCMPSSLHDSLYSYQHPSWQQQPQGTGMCEPHGPETGQAQFPHMNTEEPQNSTQQQ